MKYLIILIISVLCLSLFAQEEESVEAPKGQVKTEETKLTMTKDELDKRIHEKVQKYLQRMGRTQIVDFANELLKKEKAIEKREQDIKKREEQLLLSMKEFEKKIEDFHTKQQKILGCIDEKDKQVDSRVRHLVDIVGGMRPQQAANILSVQDADITVRILGKLPAEKVAKIFNLMDKEISARLQKQYMTMKK